MNKQMKELQKLKGVGKVLSQRLIEHSYDTIAKVAAAQEKGLDQIAGMHPKKVRSIVTQAREMIREADKDRPTWLEEKDGGNVHQVSGAGQRDEKNP